ncbi:MAG: FUSC family protein [Octadecabacter sp.]|nr:FUSC family protein [Octadecabacter sp.]
MSELPELETRIMAALERIKAGTATQSAPTEASDVNASALEAQVTALTVKLDEEQTTNAQLEERVKLLKERQDGKLAELESNVDAGRARSSRMDRELQRLRQVNAELRDINGQLREALSEGVSEPHLVNKAMLAELEALRATRAADAAEMDAILEELTPIIEREAADATG